jgi:LuxR family maltose regulon positive regulatory protein
MATPLLQTKLFIPQSRPGLVQRPRIIDKLNEGLQRGLTLISAPAGFGKSTILTEWVGAIGHQVTWLSIDDGDNDLKRFFVYFILAIQKINPSLGEDVLPVLQAADNPQTEHLLTILINDIAATDEEITLVLDDYHLIENQDIHNGLKFLIDHIPPNLHLVIASRVDPPIPLTRLRARDQITEIRSRDLRFNQTETETYLNEHMGLDLATEDISALHKRTEGWITGLHLAALSMQDRNDKHEFITAFSGGHHYIIDYLVSEVLSRQTPEIQKFLLQTSLLDRFCAPLCDAVLEMTASASNIQRLNQTNLFLISLDDERNWYRYHHLFANFLTQRLRETESEIIPTLHQRASNWLEQNRYFPEAVKHSLNGEDYQHAAQLIEQLGPDMMMQNEFDQLAQWLDAMPKKLVESVPWLCIIRAWMCDRWGQFDIGERFLQHAESAVDMSTSSTPNEAERIVRGQISAIRALYALKSAQIPQSIQHSKQALDYIPMDYFNRGVALFSLGWAKEAQGDLAGAIRVYEDGRSASLAVGNRILAQVIILQIGKVQFIQGHLHQAAETLREANQFKYERSNIKIPYASSASIGLAAIHREWNELDEALSYVQEGIEIGIASNVVDAITSGYASKALVHIARGDLDAAHQACNRAEEMVRDTPNLEAETLSKTLASRIRLNLAKNQLSEASRKVHDAGLNVDSEIENYLDIPHRILARVLIHSGRTNSASQELSDSHKMLAKVLKMTRSAGYSGEVIMTLVLQALAFEAQGIIDQSLNSLEKALVLAEPEGYIRTFIDEGAPMQALLQQVKTKGRLAAYVEMLLKAFDPQDTAVAPAIDQKLVEPLSQREIEVLRMLGTELTGPEIAGELVISLNTLRTHTKNIYAKLDVGKRRAAVRRAKELELI